VKRREMRPACKLILNRASVDAVTRQLSLALFTDAKLDLGQKPAHGYAATRDAAMAAFAKSLAAGRRPANKGRRRKIKGCPAAL